MRDNLVQILNNLFMSFDNIYIVIYG